MAITTLDGVIAGMQPPQEFLKVGTGTQVIGRLYTPNYVGSGAMAAPAGGIQGNGLLSYPGQIGFSNPGSGNTYLARFAGECINGGTLYLADRLWHNSGNSATSTSTQTISLTATGISIANPTIVTTAAHGQAAGSTFTVVITGSNSTPVIDGTYTATYVSSTTFSLPINVTGSGTAAAVRIGIPGGRDGNGTAVGSSGSPAKFGDDVMLAYEVSGTMGANTSTITANYINQDGAAKTTVSITMAASMIQGAFIPLPLAAGDTGVRAVTDHIKGTSQTSGTYHLVMYRIVGRIGLPLPGVAVSADAVTGGMPRLYDNSVPFLLWMPNTTTAPTQLSGQVIYTQG